MKRRIGSALWALSEALRIPLGPLAPQVLGWALGATPRKVQP